MKERTKWESRALLACRVNFAASFFGWIGLGLAWLLKTMDPRSIALAVLLVFVATSLIAGTSAAIHVSSELAASRRPQIKGLVAWFLAAHLNFILQMILMIGVLRVALDFCR